ncbi:MAG: hypothetical protein JXP34_03100 [Planctomycetes bacterium]|nr:hypothetical protein [Planctomycetota bacterium]
MGRRSKAERITRRGAMGRMAAGAAGLVAFARRGSGLRAGESSPEIRQVTTEAFEQSNIYCEVPYCSRNSKTFVYVRRNPKLSGDRSELMVAEIGTWKTERLDATRSLSGTAITHDGMFYYLKSAAGGTVDLWRADLEKGSPEKVYTLPADPQPRSLGTVSADARYYAYGCRLDPEWKSFGIVLVDLKEGTQRVIDRDPFILNPHPQFEPGPGLRLMIQHNRGGTYTPDGKLERLVGPEGATLYLLSIDGKRTTLQVGTPHTTPATGHEAWIGKTGEILLSVAAQGDFAAEKGNLLGVRPGAAPRVVARGYRFNHVGVSRCGRFFSCDDWQPPYKIVIGSTQKERSAVVCESGTKPGRSQDTHPHAYLTPDLRWVIFNSNRSGACHIYAARVPDGMIELLSVA